VVLAGAFLVGFSVHPFSGAGGADREGLIQTRPIVPECAAIGELQMKFPTSQKPTSGPE
jgi:hypothetical protein